jgi:DNA-binding NarL/FixJ family response regulator
MSIKVLIADDHPVLRYGLIAYLERQPDIRVVGEADGGDQVLPVIARAHPDVLLLDVNMPGMDTWHILAALPDLESPPQVLIFTAYSDPDKVVGLVRAGARGYLIKSNPPDQIVEGIRAVAGGQAWFSPAAKAALAEVASRGYSGFKRALSDRELEVLLLVAKGYSNRQVARSISVTERTVRFHLERILEKLEVSNRTEAVALAFHQGWVDK